MRSILVLFTTLLALIGQPAAAAAADNTAFDGSWSVTLTCPQFNEDDEARGYTHHFVANVKDGELRGMRGTEGEPGWHLLTGRIGADGRAKLKFDGIVNNPAYAVNDAKRGKPYVYFVRAKFEDSRGEGVRIGKRKCDFTFART